MSLTTPNDFCAKNGPGEAMSVDGRGIHSFGATSCPGEVGALMGIVIGIKNGISGRIRNGEHGMEEEKEGV